MEWSLTTSLWKVKVTAKVPDLEAERIVRVIFLNIGAIIVARKSAMNRVQYRSKVSRQVRGFSLLESLIGMFVAATTTLTVMGVVVAGNKVATQSNARTILTAAARRELDSILSVSQGNRRVVMNQAFTLPSSVTS